MKKNYFLITILSFLISSVSFGQEQMEVEGAIKIQEAQNADNGTIEYGTAGGSLDFWGRIGNNWKSLTATVGGSGLWSLQSGTNNIFYNAGNVGIGTATPSGQFHLKGNSAIGIFDFTGSSWLALHKNGVYKGFFGMWAGNDMGNDDIQLATSSLNSSGKVHLATKTQPRLTIDSDGHTGIGTINPASDALLEVSSTEEGVLIPRMTNAERDAISAGSPTTGLLVYSTDSNSFWYYDSSNWVELGNGSANNNTNAPHLNQPNNLSQGLAWNSVTQYQAHYADNGEAVIFWEDTGYRYISRYINGEWCHPTQNDALAPIGGIGMPYDIFSSDMNNSGKILFTRVVGTDIYIDELTTGTSTTTVAGPIATGLTSPRPRIALNDNGDYFVSFLKDIGGQNHVHVIGTSISSPLQISTTGSSATEHRISYSENGEAVIFWEQPTTLGNEIGVYRSEYTGGTWAAMPGLTNHFDKTFDDGFDGITLKGCHSSIDGQYLLLYNIQKDPGGAGSISATHKYTEKRTTWTTTVIGTSTDDPFIMDTFANISSSMSDNGNSLISYVYSDAFTPKSNWAFTYVGTWNSSVFSNTDQSFELNDISNGQGVIIGSMFYCGVNKYYINPDAFNLSKLANINEGIGIEGSSVLNAQLDVINNKSYLLTWVQNGKLMHMINP